MIPVRTVLQRAIPAILWLLAGSEAEAANGAANVLERADAKLRYQDCLNLANLNPTAAMGVATAWSKNKGGAPAEHCLAVAFVELKRYPEAAARLDALGRAPDMGALRATIFGQAGNAWMLAGDADKAVASFSAALALSGDDPDLYADLARAQAMRKNWSEVEADLNAALAIEPKRADLLILRASALTAEGKLKPARDDANAALRLRPNSPEALVQRGDIARAAGDLGAARRDFEAALKLAGGGETADAARDALAEMGESAKP
jgi:tetratricopeptide (TPR) repeat protein